MFETFRRCGSEGVVFKEIDAPFSPGRPNLGGSQLKFKFVESASFIVPVGRVTIPPNHPVPQIETVVEVRFLYAFRESGSIYQPVYGREREDIPTIERTTEQLKYKAEPIAARSHPSRIRVRDGNASFLLPKEWGRMPRRHSVFICYRSLIDQ